jgi:hypothetical protein
MKFYDNLSPTGKLVFNVAAYIGIATLSAFVHQKIGERRGYKKGFYDGTSPATQGELTQMYEKGETAGKSSGYQKGIWAGQPEAFQAGISFGAATLRNANVAFDPFAKPTTAPAIVYVTAETVPA